MFRNFQSVLLLIATVSLLTKGDCSDLNRHHQRSSRNRQQLRALPRPPKSSPPVVVASPYDSACSSPMSLGLLSRDSSLIPASYHQDLFLSLSLGRGASGFVCVAFNSETGEEVAIKKIGYAFDNIIDAKRTFREIKLHNHMDHDNVIAIKDIIRPSQ